MSLVVSGGIATLLSAEGDIKLGTGFESDANVCRTGRCLDSAVEFHWA